MSRDAAIVTVFTVCVVGILGLYGKLDAAQLERLFSVALGLGVGGGVGYQLGRSTVDTNKPKV